MASAGRRHTVLLRSDGNVSLCGDNGEEQCDVPALGRDTTYTQVSANDHHTLLLQSDGKVAACGQNAYGQCNIPAPAEGVTYTQVSAGGFHTLLLQSDGKVTACGYNTQGQCNIPAMDLDMTYTQVHAGFNHTLLLQSDGKVAACGENENGQCDIPAPDGAATYTQVSACHFHTLLLQSDGNVAVCGSNSAGQCDIPALDEGVTYTQVSAGLKHTLLLQSDGKVAACGNNSARQCDIPALGQGVTYTHVSTNADHTLLLQSDGMVAALGSMDDGKTQIPPLEGAVTYVRASYFGGAAIILQAFVDKEEEARDMDISSPFSLLLQGEERRMDPMLDDRNVTFAEMNCAYELLMPYCLWGSCLTVKQKLIHWANLRKEEMVNSSDERGQPEVVSICYGDPKAFAGDSFARDHLTSKQDKSLTTLSVIDADRDRGRFLKSAPSRLQGESSPRGSSSSYVAADPQEKSAPLLSLSRRTPMARDLACRGFPWGLRRAYEWPIIIFGLWEKESSPARGYREAVPNDALALEAFSVVTADPWECQERAKADEEAAQAPAKAEEAAKTVIPHPEKPPGTWSTPVAFGNGEASSPKTATGSPHGQGTLKTQRRNQRKQKHDSNFKQNDEKVVCAGTPLKREAWVDEEDAEADGCPMCEAALKECNIWKMTLGEPAVKAEDPASSNSTGKDQASSPRTVTGSPHGQGPPTAAPASIAAASAPQAPQQAGVGDSLNDLLQGLNVRNIPKASKALKGVGIESRQDLFNLDNKMKQELDTELKKRCVNLGDRAKIKTIKPGCYRCLGADRR